MSGGSVGWWTVGVDSASCAASLPISCAASRFMVSVSGTPSTQIKQHAFPCAGHPGVVLPDDGATVEAVEHLGRADDPSGAKFAHPACFDDLCAFCVDAFGWADAQRVCAPGGGDPEDAVERLRRRAHIGGVGFEPVSEKGHSGNGEKMLWHFSRG